MSRTRSLRSRLFRSHLAVMVVAVLVMFVIGAGLAAILFEVGVFADEGGRGRDGEHDGFGGAVLLGLLVALVSAVAAASVVAARVARRLGGSVSELREATHRLAEGNYAVRVPGSDATELNELAGDVNALAEQLETTERRRLELITDLAHELRTPLTTIEASMEALMDGVVEPSDEVFASIAQESARLKRLAFDLSALSRAQEGAYPLERVRLDLREAVASVADRLAHQFEAKRVELTVEAGPTVPVSADADRLAQILTNIIGNALAYTDSGGSVTIGVEAAGDSALVRVRDTGKGLAPHELARIFERFYRVDPRVGPGTGVGLTIARQLARAHGGDVRAESEGLGEGTQLEVRLPLLRE